MPEFHRVYPPVHSKVVLSPIRIGLVSRDQGDVSNTFCLLGDKKLTLGRQWVSVPRCLCYEVTWSRFVRRVAEVQESAGCYFSSSNNLKIQLNNNHKVDTRSIQFWPGDWIRAGYLAEGQRCMRCVTEYCNWQQSNIIFPTRGGIWVENRRCARPDAAKMIRRVQGLVEKTVGNSACNFVTGGWRKTATWPVWTEVK